MSQTTSAFQLHKPFRTRIYGVGGAATNIVSTFEANANKDNITNLDICYIDGSTANLHSGVSEENIMIFTDAGKQLNGGGKNRAETIARVKPQIPQVLKRFAPGDFSIVVHSNGGAVGSTGGPLIVEELLSKGFPVMVIQIGSTGSRKEIDNTVGTIKDYIRISKRQNKPIVAYYRENNLRNSRGEVDRDVMKTLFAASALFSDKNPGMDKNDLVNLLNYSNPNITKFKPELSGIEFFRDSVDVPKHVVPQAMAKLANRNSTAEPVELPRVEYVADADLGETTLAHLSDVNMLIALVYTGDYRVILERLQEEQALYKEDEANRDTTSMSVVLDDDDEEGVM